MTLDEALQQVRQLDGLVTTRSRPAPQIHAMTPTGTPPAKKGIASSKKNNAGKSQSEQLADLYGSYIDKPNDPNASGSLNSEVFENQFSKISQPQNGYATADIGTLQQNPNYRGIRLVLPQSGFTYLDGTRSAGQALHRQGFPRIMTEGPAGPPIEGDPHYNNIPQYPHNEPPDQGGLREEVYGHLITRGYPVYGGTGDFGGEFPHGFNPVGFGQRDIPAGADALAPPRPTR